MAAPRSFFRTSSAATAAEIGMSTARSRAISRSTGAVKTPSASPAWIACGLLAAAEIDAEGEIARLRARAGQQEIAETGQAHHGLRLRAIGPAETDQFGKAARGQRRQGAGAEPAAGDDRRRRWRARSSPRRRSRRRARRRNDKAGTSPSRPPAPARRRACRRLPPASPPSAGRAPHRRQSSARTRSPAPRSARIRRSPRS